MKKSQKDSLQDDGFNSRIPQSYINYIKSQNISCELKIKKLFYKKTINYCINNSNRRHQWLKITGGDLQLNNHQAKQLYEIKSEDMSGPCDGFSSFSSGYLEPPHDCFTNPAHDCCLTTTQSLDGINIECSNLHCPQLIHSQSDNKNQYSCCFYYRTSKHIADVILETYPNITYCPLLIYLTTIFSLIFTHEYEIYACLSGILKNTRLNFIDETISSCRVASAILRFFSVQLLHALIQKRNIRHPWLKQLYKLNPYVFSSTEEDPECFNSWLILDWPVLLFKNMRVWKIIGLVDLYLQHGVKILYRQVLSYLSVLFVQINSEHPSDYRKDLLISENIVEKLSNIISNETILIKHSKTISVVDRLRITNKNLNKLKSIFFNVYIKKCSFLSNISEIDFQKNRFDSNQTWPSTVIYPHEWDALMSWLPPNIQILSPSLMYSSSVHGWNLRTFYLRSENAEPIVIIIRTTCSAVFGGYLTECLKTRNNIRQNGGSSFGTGETFVFSMRPVLKKYPWIQLEQGLESFRSTLTSPISARMKGFFSDSEEDKLDHNIDLSSKLYRSSSDPPLPNDIFIVANDKELFIGGGGGYAIWLDDTLVNGSSSHCCTFNNESFVSNPVGFFKSSCVEVFSFLDTNFVIV